MKVSSILTSRRLIKIWFIMITVALLLLSLPIGIAAASASTFYGIDLGNGNNQPISHPNADVAHNNFIAELNSYSTENFESFTNHKVAPITLDFGSLGTGTLNGKDKIDTALSTGQFPISGTKFWVTDSSFSITFSNPQVAFGFYGTDFGDARNQNQVKVTFEGDTTQTYTIPTQPNQDTNSGNVIFYGVIDKDSPFTKVTIANTNTGSDTLAIDDITIGTINNGSGSIPEFPSIAVPAVAILGLVVIFGRKKNMV